MRATTKFFLLMGLATAAVPAMPAGAARHRGHDRQLQLLPDPLVITVGGTVKWTNGDNTSHTVTADDGSFNSGGKGAQGTFEHTFPQGGAFGYHCAIHPSMQGTVQVDAPTTTTTAAATTTTAWLRRPRRPRRRRPPRPLERRPRAPLPRRRLPRRPRLRRRRPPRRRTTTTTLAPVAPTTPPTTGAPPLRRRTSTLVAGGATDDDEGSGAVGSFPAWLPRFSPAAASGGGRSAGAGHHPRWAR